MSTYKELREEFDRKVKELQAKCSHPTSTWMELWWAIAHSTGKAVRVCDTCSERLEEISLAEAYEKGYIKSPEQRLKEYKEREGIKVK